MNRRLTGWFAWGALALVIGVPSVDMVLSTPENSVSMAAVDARKEPFFGPMPAKKPVVEDVFEAPVANRAPVETPPAGMPDISVPTIAAPEPETAVADAVTKDTETKDVALAEPKKPAQAGAQVTPVVPLAIRVVGDQRMAPKPVKITPDAADKAVTAETETAKTDRPAETTALAAVPVVATDSADTATQVEAAEPLQLRGSDSETLSVAVADPQAAPVAVTAPKPLPASMRPPAPVRASRSVATFEDEVRASVDNLRAAGRRAPAFEDYSDRQPVWGDDPRLRRGQQLETFAPGGFVADDSSDSEFYELWREEQRPVGFRRSGSFEEQLPARRGSGIRMDLLQ